MGAFKNRWLALAGDNDVGLNCDSGHIVNVTTVTSFLLDNLYDALLAHVAREDKCLSKNIFILQPIFTV